MSLWNEPSDDLIKSKNKQTQKLLSWNSLQTSILCSGGRELTSFLPTPDSGLGCLRNHLLEALPKEIDKDWGAGRWGLGVVRPPFFQARFLHAGSQRPESCPRRWRLSSRGLSRTRTWIWRLLSLYSKTFCFTSFNGVVLNTSFPCPYYLKILFRFWVPPSAPLLYPLFSFVTLSILSPLRHTGFSEQRHL